jgi:hypothetical protein
MTAIVNWLGSKVAWPLTLLLGAALAWQSARIEGWPLIGGGLKAQVAQLRQQTAMRDLATAKARAAALAAQQQQTEAMQAVARDHAAADQTIQTQIQTVIQKVPVYVSAKNDAGCVLNWGAVRLLDAAASGAGLDGVAARIAPGQPDDTASDVKLSEAVALLAADLGIARQNADQLGYLEKAVTP